MKIKEKIRKHWKKIYAKKCGEFEYLFSTEGISILGVLLLTLFFLVLPSIVKICISMVAFKNGQIEEVNYVEDIYNGTLVYCVISLLAPVTFTVEGLIMRKSKLEANLPLKRIIVVSILALLIYAILTFCVVLKWKAHGAFAVISFILLLYALKLSFKISIVDMEDKLQDPVENKNKDINELQQNMNENTANDEKAGVDGELEETDFDEENE